jgi:hypothetical protein
MDAKIRDTLEFHKVKLTLGVDKSESIDTKALHDAI